MPRYRKYRSFTMPSTCRKILSLSRNREEVLIPEWNILNYRVLASYPNYKKLRGTRASKFCTILNIYIYIETKEEREVTISNRMER